MVETAFFEKRNKKAADSAAFYFGELSAKFPRMDRYFREW
jgi:hypothetical protein